MNLRASSEPDFAPAPFQEHRFTVPGHEAGMRLDDFLSRRFPLLSRTKLRALVAAGAAVREYGPDRKSLSIGTRLQRNEQVLFRWQPRRVPPGYPERAPLTILWEDEHVVAVDKTASMLVHPTRGVKRGTLANALLGYLNPNLSDEMVVEAGAQAALWPRFVHRLDRETSGVVLVAKDTRAASLLGKALARGDFEKRYLAIVCRQLTDAAAGITAPIARFDGAPPHWRSSPDGQQAETRLRVIGACDGYSLCQLQPITGRTNQLRIHCAHLNAPILGDVVYGGEPAERTMLHAWRLSFTHPVTEVRISVEAPIPMKFRQCWKAITAPAR